MAIEIERKFLLASDEWRQRVYSSRKLQQGYLNDSSESSIRIRTANTQAWLNIKSVVIGATRQEFEYEIPLDDANQMLSTLCSHRIVKKTRHLVQIAHHTWEIDEFEGDNSDLIVAEIELNDEDEQFEKPSWIGKEVTMDKRYYNNQLSKTPFCHW